MNRGEALQFGFELDTDGRQWNVTVHGSRRPDFTFPGIEEFIEWLREENEGVQIARMAKKGLRLRGEPTSEFKSSDFVTITLKPEGENNG